MLKYKITQLGIFLIHCLSNINRKELSILNSDNFHTMLVKYKPERMVLIWIK